jgi:hypothetical protein
MGPKVEACLRFAGAGGEAVIASLTEVGEAMAGKAGTHIVPDAAANGATRDVAETASPASSTSASAAKRGAAATQAPARKRRRSSRRGLASRVVA